jgi:hypothetical protein
MPTLAALAQTGSTIRSLLIVLPHRASRTVTNKRERNDPKPFRSSDTRVIISAYRLEKLMMITRVSIVIRPEGLGDLRSPV